MNGVLNIFTTAIMVIFALVLHELAHVFAVTYLGGRVDKLKAFPLGFMAKFTGLEKLLPWERYIIYGAGSLANGIIALWALSVSRISYFGIPWLEEIAFYNLVLCIFNLAPVLPLDGGRLLRQFLSNRIGMRPTNRIMLKLGYCLGIVLIFLGFVQVILYNYNVTLLCAGIYIKRQNKKMKLCMQMEFFSALNAKNVPARARLMPVRYVKISPGATIRHALDCLTMDHFTEFYIDTKLGSKSTKVIGFNKIFLSQKKECQFISEKTLLKYIFINGLQGTVGDLLPNNGF